MLGVLLAMLILIALLWLLGVPLATMAVWGMLLLIGLIGLGLLGIIMFFLCCLCALPHYHRAQGKFVRFEHFRQFDRAVYSVEEKEYTCIFPAENIGREKIYHSVPKFLLVRAGKRRATAYDLHSLLIVGIGSGFSLLSLAGVLLFLMHILR